MTKLSIIILSYNTKELTLRCIRSIINQYKKQLEFGEFEIIIIDNGSLDQSAGSLKKEIKGIKNINLIENKENLGFSKGNNLASKKIKGEYILFLNSDTEVLDDGFIKMIQFLNDKKDIGVLGGKLINPNGSSQKSAGNFFNLINVFLMLIGLERIGFLRESPKKEKQVDWVSGACMMIRTNLFKKIKGFDESFFMYMEDMELCYRVKKNNYNVYFYPEVKILHKELGSSNKTFAIVQIYKGLLFFYRKHKNYYQYLFVKFLLYTKAMLALAIGILTRNNYLTYTYREAIKK